ncbi:MAG: hypothetical protein N2322_03325, partial [Terrimicrobiaceae bacterium]|nr:hypothetical protein [Terrimicrobiaceae bacterium]
MIFRVPAAGKAAILLLVAAGAASAETEPSPDAADILQAARINPLGEPIRLDARLRTGKDSTPFRIVVADGRVRYEFDNPSQVLTLELGDNDSTLTDASGGRTATIRPARFDEPVRGTE